MITTKGTWTKFEEEGERIAVNIVEYGRTKEGTGAPYIKYYLENEIGDFKTSKAYQMNIPPWELDKLEEAHSKINNGCVTGVYELYTLICTDIDDKWSTVKLEKRESRQHESWNIHDTTKQETLSAFEKPPAEKDNDISDVIKLVQQARAKTHSIDEEACDYHKLQNAFDEILKELYAGYGASVWRMT